jgi:hypothetical protein
MVRVPSKSNAEEVKGFPFLPVRGGVQRGQGGKGRAPSRGKSSLNKDLSQRVRWRMK